MSMSFNFRHTKRFMMPVMYGEFMRAAQTMVRLVAPRQPSVNVMIRSTEMTQAGERYRNIGILDGNSGPIYKNIDCELKYFDRSAWKRSMDLQLSIRDAAHSPTFLIHLSLCKRSNRSVISFYGQNVDEELLADIHAHFGWSSLLMYVSTK